MREEEGYKDGLSREVVRIYTASMMEVDFTVGGVRRTTSLRRGQFQVKVMIGKFFPCASSMNYLRTQLTLLSTVKRRVEIGST